MSGVSADDKGNEKPEEGKLLAETDKTQVNYTPDSEDTGSYKYYPDDPESTWNRFRFQAKGDSQYFDPCEESSKLSMKCLELNNYDRQLCKEYFDAYRECKKQWLQSRRRDKSQWEWDRDSGDSTAASDNSDGSCILM
ncbi:similar to Saccharomyces cerevisiae YHR116W COX23 Mitochondrial intermembrane space protein that functions in mitochondrial copper homeostasis [Maudiozyma saulgeensis]|uniref:Cytochrome c oxidase-assembly factor COX23, mitochondrial n=1 Tax=Maudiozyma saulgeensis TaxID=1789683 RepID=A0A1X7R008_9SACH|nr:similar to Saccharomyces cerevisiae YHR116W COX23 Mitochondrial intermembrane space protein that functions in mitochondrial copper homeostasis [Kazachstania saulgeensis]